MYDKVRESISPRKVLVIGLDGVPWDLVNMLGSNGDLPNITYLIQKGTSAKLKSTIPPLTGPAWASFATGKNPGKHGCFDFVKPEGSLRNIRIIDSLDIKGETFYEILNRHQRRCILVNLPISYPPRIKGIIMSSFCTRGKSFIFPRSLVNEIPELEGYRIFPDTSPSAKEDYIKEIIELEEIRFECSKKLFTKNWDFFFILFSGTDWVQHIMYRKLLDEESRLGIELFTNIDSYIGWFTRNVPSNTTILLMSDHGFRIYNGIFYTNEWLRKTGYLKLQTASRTFFKRQSLARGLDIHLNRTEQPQAKASKKHGISSPIFLNALLMTLKAVFPLKTVSRFFRRRIKFSFEPNWEKTYAYSYGWGGIYLNSQSKFEDGTIETEQQYRKIKDEIISKLNETIDPKASEKVVNSVWPSEEVFRGKEVPQGPDIIFTSKNYHDKEGFYFKIFRHSPIGTHSLNGIFVAYGSDIESNQFLKEIEIIDIAPTILHIMDVPIPGDVDGKILKELFDGKSELRRKESKFYKPSSKDKQAYTSSKEDEEKVKERLRKLGYF